MTQSLERRGAAIDVTGLRKEYLSGPARVVALDDINLRIAPGEFLCIVGPSGCGKSTLLRILAGLTAPSGGTIKIEARGWPVESAMVFQESGLFPWMSIEANVGFGLMTRGVPAEEAAARIDAALKLVGLTRFRRHYPHQLSGGMRQRSAIARAFVTDPGMLLMDEPLAALDAQNRVILQAELLRIWEQTRKTVIYITHSIEEALLLGDPHRGHDRPAGPHQTHYRRAVFPPAQPHDVVGIAGVWATQARYLAGAGGGGHARTPRRGEMSVGPLPSCPCRHKCFCMAGRSCCMPPP